MSTRGWRLRPRRRAETFSSHQAGAELIRFVAWFALVSLGVAACGAESPQQLVEVADLPEDPLAAFSQRSASEFAALQQGMEVTAIPCMKELGYDLPSQVEVALAADPESEIEFGLDAPTVATYGYLGPPEMPRPPPPDLEMTDNEREAFAAALWGDPAQSDGVVVVTDIDDEVTSTYLRAGCMGTAEWDVFGDIGAYESSRRILEQAQKDALIATLADPRMNEAINAWRDCMAPLGHDYDAPTDAVEVGLVSPKASASIDLAVADQGCRESSGYAELGTRLLWTYEQQWLERNPKHYEEFQMLWQTALARAKERAQP